VEAALDHPDKAGIYNVSDDLPAPPQDVVGFACQLLGVELPPLVAFEDADLSPMARSFYGECKRVDNARLKDQLGVKLAFPNYEKGLMSLFKELPKSDER
jgi:nucleoside-diphosphate-sugar epimerase